MIELPRIATQITKLRLCLVAFVLSATMLGAALAAQPANAYVYITYCNGVFVNAGTPCTYPPGNSTDPCNSSLKSWGGWDKNFGDYYGSGYPSLQVYVQYYPSDCGAEDVCIFRSLTADHINDGGCAGSYSWYAGRDVDLVVTTYQYNHTISGTGRYP